LLQSNLHGRVGGRDGLRGLIRRGADVNMNVGRTPYRMTPFNQVLLGSSDCELGRDFALLLIGSGLALKRPAGNWDPLGTTILALREHPTRAYVEVFVALLQAGASLDSVLEQSSAETLMQCFESSHPGLVQNEHWVACKTLIFCVRAAGGTWNAYAQELRKRVLRLRSLVARGRARPHRAARARAGDPIIAPIFRLPNELCWHVLQFWRATSNATGEVL